MFDIEGAAMIEGSCTQQVAFRVPEARLQQYTSAAKLLGMSRSELLRRLTIPRVEKVLEAARDGEDPEEVLPSA